MARSKSLLTCIEREIEQATWFLVGRGLVDDQNVPSRRTGSGGIIQLQAGYWDSAPRMQEKIPYTDLYERLIETRAYDLRFLDGALVQLQYEFEGSDLLLRSVLRFLPSPDLTSYQEDPDLYLRDELYGHVIDRRVVSVPFRFDFDGRAGVARDCLHPVSHLTLGQYPHCRVAAASAVSPYYFIEFVLRSFYRSQYELGTAELPGPFAAFPRTVTRAEESTIHLELPTG